MNGNSKIVPVDMCPTRNHSLGNCVIIFGDIRYYGTNDNDNVCVCVCVCVCSLDME